MRTAVLAFALLPAAAIADERDVSQPAATVATPAKQASACQNPRNEYTVINPLKGGAPASIRPLGEEPLANRYLGVQRFEDGCDVPVKIADGVGDKQR